MGDSGPAGYVAGTAPENAYAQFKALNPDDRQGYIDQYLALSGNQQQGWLDATGQTDPTGGMNNPNYVAPPAPVPPPPKSGQYPSTPVPTNTWTPDPVDPPGTPPAPPAPTTQEGGNPWDDLTSPRFLAWFNAELDAGRSPGLNFTSTDPSSAYGTYNSVGEQQAMMAQFQALPPEVQAAYVQQYMGLNQGEQAQWRSAFGADPMVGTVQGADLSLVTRTPGDHLNNWDSPYEAERPQMGWIPSPNGQAYRWGILPTRQSAYDMYGNRVGTPRIGSAPRGAF